MQTRRHAIGAAKLSAKQVDEFRRQGCVVVRNVLPPASVERLSAWTDELAAWPETPGRHWVFHEESRRDPGQQLIQRIENIAPFHAGFAELAEALKASVSQLFGEPGVLFKEKVNYKLSGGDGFQAHQDAQAGWNAYARSFVTVALAIDPATPESGCLEIAPGFHRGEVAREWEPLTEGDLEGVAFTSCETQPGDAIFLDAFVPHRSEPNRTGRSRRVYFATYNRLSEGDHRLAYYEDKRKSFPPDIEREPGRAYVYRV